MNRFERNANVELETEEGPITPDEIKTAIKGLKQGKAPGVDRI